MSPESGKGDSCQLFNWTGPELWSPFMGGEIDQVPNLGSRWTATLGATVLMGPVPLLHQF